MPKMLLDLKGFLMLMRPVTCGLLLWALSPQLVAQSAPAQKAKPPSKALSQARPAAPTPQARARSAADVTARLQAQAIAAAAGQAALSAGSAQDALARAASDADATAPALTEVRLSAQPSVASEPLAVISLPTSLTAPSSPAVTSLYSAVSSQQSVMVQPDALLSDMGPQDLAIAQRIHQGVLPCELGISVRVEADAARPGYFRVMGKGFRYRMRPVATSTGALRLEDAQAGAVWLQLANKSMLMDQKKGRRLANDCAHPEQVAFAHDMKTNPPPMLFDTQGMGRSKD